MTTFRSKWRSIVSIFCAFVLVSSMFPVLPTFAFAEDPGAQAPASQVPYANSFAHNHNMPGWTCRWNDAEHTHTADCYEKQDAPVCGIEAGAGAHTHDDSCYETVAGAALTSFILAQNVRSTAEVESDESDDSDASQESVVHPLVTLVDADDELEVSDTPQAVDAAAVDEDDSESDADTDPSGSDTDRKLTCGKEESAGHVHSDDCYYELTCGLEEHTHSDACDAEHRICETEFALLTVEYFFKVDDKDYTTKEIRVAQTYQSLLLPGSPYKVKLPVLDDKNSYKYDSYKGLTRIDGVDQEATTTIVDEGGALYATGTLENDTLLKVYYDYTKPYAPYLVNYFGKDPSTNDEILIYSYEGQGHKDAYVTVEKEVNDLISNLWDALNNEEFTTRPADAQLGEAFIRDFTQHVSNLYRSNITEDEGADQEYLWHDVTPLLEAIAKSQSKTINTLSRVNIKSYMAKILAKQYGIDETKGTPYDDKVKVTGDSKAEKNFYYIDGSKVSVNFITGSGSATVDGIPQEMIPQAPDDDNISIDYEIFLEPNSITTYSGVDISAYTQNISASSENYDFVGWHNTDGFDVIMDYSDTNPAYSSVEVYSPEELAGILGKMPSVNTNFRAVWKSRMSTYTVQLWFESDTEEGTYVESHSYDMTRRAKMGSDLTYNDFDRDRADETLVASVSNGGGSQYPVIIQDSGEGGSLTTDMYYSWASYMSSPFYGFDLAEEAPLKLVKSDGSPSNTTGNQANGQTITLGDDGQTVLNVFYSRETFEIKIHPAVEVYQYTLRTDKFETLSGLDETYASGGRELSDLTADAAANDEQGVVTISGKFGYPVPEEYLYGGATVTSLFSGENANVDEESTDASGTGPTYPLKYVVPSGQKLRFTTWVSSDELQQQKTTTTKSFDSDVELMFTGLTAIAPDMFVDSVKDLSDGKNTHPLFSSAPTGDYSVFGIANDYALTNDGLTVASYGNHTLDLYPHYMNTDDEGNVGPMTFYVDYYLQPLPDEDLSGKEVHTYNAGADDELKVYKLAGSDGGHTTSFVANSYTAKKAISVPSGFTALAWRASFYKFNNDGNSFYGFTGGIADDPAIKPLDAYTKYLNPNQFHTATPAMCSCGGAAAGNRNFRLGSTSGNYNSNGSFNDDNLTYIGDSRMYLSDWKVWYLYHKAGCRYYNTTTSGQGTNATAVGYYDPSAYWVGNWVKTAKGTASLDGTITGYNNLIKDAYVGDADSNALLSQLRSSVAIGNLIAAGAPLNNPSAQTYHFMTFNGGEPQNNAQNSVLMARNKHTITYHTCYLDSGGNLVRDDEGNIETKELYTTATDFAPEIYYDQPLGVDPSSGQSLYSGYKNYYNAMFSPVFGSDGRLIDFEFEGYGPSSYQVMLRNGVTDTLNATRGIDGTVASNLEGGYGKWYLDPDGTIPFTEENMARMPDGHVDVYYHYSGTTYDVYFVDNLHPNGVDYKNVEFNGERRDINNVYDHQVVKPNGHAEPLATDPSDADYIFDGWFYDEDGKNPFDFNREITEDTIVYAHWTPKKPTDYTIKHILIGTNGGQTLLKEDKDTGNVGSTVHANALGEEWEDGYDHYYYYEGMFFRPDHYSKSMVLNEDPKDNELVFYYQIVSRSYLIEYRDIDTGDIIYPSDGPFETTLSVVTTKYRDLSEDGWELVGYAYQTDTLSPNGETVFTYYYRKVADPAPPETGTSVIIRAAKLLDGMAPSGTRFSFVLSGSGVEQTKSAVDGTVTFDALIYDAPGTYEYTIRETNTGEANVIYDESVWTVQVVVAEDDEGLLFATVSFSVDGVATEASPIFANRTTSSSVPPVDEETPDPKRPIEIPFYGTDLAPTGDTMRFMLGVLSAAALVAMGAMAISRRRRADADADE